MKKRARNKLPKILSREDVKKMLKAIDIKKSMGLRNKTAIYLMYRAGFRVGEVCNLSPDDINWKLKLLYIQQSKGNKDRYVPMDDSLLDICSQWNDVRPQSKYFICTKYGSRLSERYLRRVCYQLSEDTGIYINDNHEQRPVHPHTFRHCFATELLEDGWNPREVQEMLGHSNLDTTMIYLSVRPDKLMEKMRRRVWES